MNQSYRKYYGLLLVFTIFLKLANGYKILVALPTTFKSHYQFGSELSKALAADGSEVTVISPFKQSNPPPNYKEVYLEHTQKAVEPSNIQFFYHSSKIFCIKIFATVLFITICRFNFQFLPIT